MDASPGPADWQLNEEVESSITHKNAMLEELTRRHEDVLHILEHRIWAVEQPPVSAPSVEQDLQRMQIVNGQLTAEIEKLTEDLQASYEAHDQLSIRYQIQSLEIEKLQVQHELHEEMQKSSTTPNDVVEDLQGQVTGLQRELRDVLNTLVHHTPSGGAQTWAMRRLEQLAVHLGPLS